MTVPRTHIAWPTQPVSAVIAFGCAALLALRIAASPSCLIDPLTIMQTGMSSACLDHKIFWSIVLLVHISVVNVLSRQKWTPQYLLHYQAVFPNALFAAGRSNSHVSVVIHLLATLPLRVVNKAMHRAPSPIAVAHLGGGRFERLSALCAGPVNFRHAAGCSRACPRTKRALQRWLCVEHLATGQASPGYGTLLGHRSSPFGVMLPAVCSSAGALLSLHYIASGRDKQS